MKRLRTTMPVIALVHVSALPAGAQLAAPNGTGIPSAGGPIVDTEPTAPMCRVQILVEQPGYRYTVTQIENMVQESEVVVRAVAMDSTQTLDGRSYVRFQTTEVVVGSFGEAEFTLTGHFVDEDGFNTLSVPYQLGRPAGGSCHAEHYRQGGEYLFLLKSPWGYLTPYWIPLGPTNEQIRGAGDPWLQWVREQLAEDPGMGGRPPLL
ncbi:MAG: hypothetical protein OXL34_17155 [Gemmatimonadota bacterium]|nr:hypothetical protein [Gemmatimonadota bacterium]